MPDAPLIARFEFDSSYHYAATLGAARSHVLVGPNRWWATTTPDGPVSTQLVQLSANEIETRSWGPGSAWATKQVPDLLGDADNADEFAPDGIVLDLWRRRKFKQARTNRVWDATVGAILGQKVQATKAKISIRGIRNKFGETAPGPKPSKILPTPDKVAQLNYSDFHELGVEKKRADTIIRAAREMPRVESNPDTAIARLGKIRGIGPWTLALIDAAVFGNADAVPVGDYHIPNVVAWNLHGIPRATDDEMLDMLEPYRGHRWRVIRLCEANSGAPKYGPRLSLTGFGIKHGL